MKKSEPQGGFFDSHCTLSEFISDIYVHGSRTMSVNKLAIGPCGRKTSVYWRLAFNGDMA